MSMLFSIIFLVAAIWAGRRFVYQPAAEALEKRGITIGLGGAFIFLVAIALTVSMASLDSAFLPLGIVLAGLVAWMFFKKADSKREGRQRGGQLVETGELVKLAKAEDSAAEILLGEVGIPRKMENRHFLLAGSTGSGKSQAFYQIAEVARRRGDAAVVADVNGEMLARFFDPSRGDVILNPLDQRSARWSPLAEIAGPWDADRISKSLIPAGSGSAAEWNHYAQVLVSAALAKVWGEDGKNHDLTSMLLQDTNEVLKEKLVGTDAAQLFAPGAERMLSSIRAITATYIKPLSYLHPAAGRDGFSLTQFIQDEACQKNGSWVFFPVRDDFFKTFKSLVAGQADVAISALLSSPDDEARRVWFMLDEFASWGRIDSIDALLTKARKKGGVGVLGLQSISQIRETYGREGAQTLLANLGNWLTLRSGDAETADFMSKNIGDEQIRRVNEGRVLNFV